MTRRSDHPRSSRQRYRGFVEDYKHRRLDDESTQSGDGRRSADGTKEGETASAPESGRVPSGKRRQYLRDYLRWLRPHRNAVGVVFVLALLAAGLQMIEPLFMRFIVDRVLLNTALDTSERLARLHMTGAVFLGVILVASLVTALKDYRQRLLNVRVM